MSADLKQQIAEAAKTAMRRRDKPGLQALRGIQAAIKQREVDGRSELDDPQVLAVLRKMARRHRESIKQFSEAGRNDLVARETLELETLESFLPDMLSEHDLQQHVLAAIEATQATGLRDMGKVMKQLQGALQGRADMADAGRMVRARLSGLSGLSGET